MRARDGRRALQVPFFLLDLEFIVAGTSCLFCYNQVSLEFAISGIFAGTAVICSWDRLFPLLQSILCLEFAVSGIFAGTGVKCCWNRLFLLLQSNLLEFDVREIVAGTRVNYCSNPLFLLLQ